MFEDFKIRIIYVNALTRNGWNAFNIKYSVFLLFPLHCIIVRGQDIIVIIISHLLSCRFGGLVD